MPIRAHSQPHRKSKLGCKICKARKIKCDEVRPVCGSCFRRFPNPENYCEFEVRSPASTPKPFENTAPHHVPSPEYLFPAPRIPGGSARVSKSVELRLFHYYCTTTSRMMPHSGQPKGVDMWNIHAPTVAFDCEYVYNAILGITAFHVLTSSPDDSSLRPVAFHYIDTTISQLRPALSQVTPSNSQSLLFASILVSLYTRLRSRCLLSSTAYDYTLPLDQFYIQQGIHQLCMVTDPYVGGSPVRLWLNFFRWGDQEGMVGGRERKGCDEAFSVPGWENLLAEPSFFIDFSSTEISQAERKIYEGATKRLLLFKDAIHARKSHAWLRQLLSALPPTFPEGFLELLEKKDQVAIALFARFFGLVKFVDDVWWLKGGPEFEIWGMRGMLKESKESERLMEWPMKVVKACQEG